MTAYISATDVYFSYPNYVTALKGITLEIGLGEFMAIMGENGAGKTTLVKHFLGLLRPTKGSVIVDGVDTRETTVAELSRKVGYVFQNPLYQLFGETVEKEVALGLRPLRLSKEEENRRVTQVLRELDLERYRKHHPLMLSEGERKSVALASVLVMDPQVLIMDEPTLGQDALEKRRLEGILRRLHQAGRTIVLVSHDVEFVFDTSERIITMADGRILTDGPKGEVVKDRDLFKRAALVEPQILLLAFKMSGLGMSEGITSVDDAYRQLLPLLGVRDGS